MRIAREMANPCKGDGKPLASSKQALGKAMALLSACHILAISLLSTCLELTRGLFSCAATCRSSDSKTPFLSQRNAVSLIATCRFSILVLLMMMVGVNATWGEDDLTGYYYLTNVKASDFYMCPAETSSQFWEEDQPFLTTHQLVTGSESKFLWLIWKEGDYYHIINENGGVDKYITINGKPSIATDANAHRRRIHLQEVETPSDDNEFVIAREYDSNTGSPYNIRHKTLKVLVNKVAHKYFSVAGNNSNDWGPPDASSHAGLIGLYSEAGDNPGNNTGAQWNFIPYDKCVPPVISCDDGVVSLRCATSGSTIYYTTNGNNPDPTDETQRYNAPFNITQGMTITAIAVKDNFVNSKYVSKTFAKLLEPTIDFDENTNKVTISSTETGVDFYYTTAEGIVDASTLAIPTRTDNLYDNTNQLSLTTTTTIKVVTVKDGYIKSDAVSKTIVYMPTITLEGGPYTYTGEAKTPSISSVMVGETTISNYDVSYADNTNAGTATLTIRNNANSDYFIYGTKEFTISRASLTVTANDHSITYGDEPANNGVTYSGFVGEETKSVLTGTLAYAYSYSQYGDVGSYTITLSGLTSDNYNISYVDGTLTVNPKALTITAEAKTKVYGDDDPALTYTSEGLVNGDAITGALSRVYGEDVGDYDISQGTLAAPNYSITYTGANLTITPKTLTVTAKSRTITYGDKPTNDGVTYSGFAYYENENFLLGTLAYAYSYEQYGDVGSYTITPSGLSNDNYNITFAPGTLTVDQKEVGLDWSETTSFPYDGNSHGLTATATGLVNSDEIGVTVSGEQTNAGNYTATASELTGTKAGNYKLPADNTQGFTIAKAALSVTAADNAIIYGQAPSGNGVTYDGFVNSETGSELEGTVDYDYSYTQFGDVGDYTITPKGLTSNNYDISFVAGTLTVDQKEVDITWDGPTSLEYNGSAQAPTATATGMVNNDAITVTVLGAQTNAGEDYTATASLTGDKAGNYKLPAANTQSFTISRKSIVDGTTLDSHYTLDFGEGNTILLTDDVIGSALEVGTDYTVGNDTDPSDKYSQRSVTAIGNYTGSFVVRNVVISFTTDTDQEEWSATFAAEAADESDIGHALPEGISAFIISDIEGEWAIPEPLNYIPAGVPVLLVAHKQINGFEVIQAENGDVASVDDKKTRNKLKEVTTESAHFNTKEIYVLYKNEFVLNKDGYLGKGKVYMENPNYDSSSPAPAHLYIAWDNLTGIEDVRCKMEDGRSERWYTLDGRRLSGKPATKGLYILNGKKTVVKN